MHWLLFPLSAVSMLGLLFIMLMMDTAMQETPPTYYVRRQMPVAEPVAEPEEPEKPEEPEEPVAGYGEDFGEALEDEFDDEPLEPPEEFEEDSVDESQFMEYTQRTWDGCQPFLFGDSVDGQLQLQLGKVIEAFREANITYALYAGTLIGALRGRPNEYEVDNDILIPSQFVLTEQIRYMFYKRGLHIFKSSIYRICNLGKMDQPRNPWSGTYSTYTDLYSFLPYLHCDPKDIFSTRHWLEITSFETVQYGNVSAVIPSRVLSKECLDIRYGTWSIGQHADGWKRNVHELFGKT